jgi:thiamine pyrophosphate-dependent acetolactate synthase large subunit-like protein
MAKRVTELMVEVLSGAGVKRVYGVSGDSLNDLPMQYAHGSSFSGFTCGMKRLQQPPE